MANCYFAKPHGMQRIIKGAPFYNALHSDRLPSEALCCGKIPSYFEAVTGKLEARLRNDFWESFLGANEPR
jgi:hypothetical protein